MIELQRRTRARQRHPEQDMQRTVCQYWALAYPQSWAKTFHSPQGIAAKNRKLAAIFKGIGVKPGVFDLLCIHRRGTFHGLALELKATRGRPSDEQRAWLEHFTSEGWSARFAYSFEMARACIDEYHRLAPCAQESQRHERT